MPDFGLNQLGSVEVFFDSELGWSARGYAGPARTGQVGDRVATAGDEALGVATMLTGPTLVANAGYSTIGDWALDDSEHTAWINVRAGKIHDQLSQSGADAILDAEIRWERDGFGRQTPRG